MVLCGPFPCPPPSPPPCPTHHHHEAPQHRELLLPPLKDSASGSVTAGVGTVLVGDVFPRSVNSVGLIPHTGYLPRVQGVIVQPLISRHHQEAVSEQAAVGAFGSRLIQDGLLGAAIGWTRKEEGWVRGLRVASVDNTIQSTP